jgi:hypothetical protein
MTKTAFLASAALATALSAHAAPEWSELPHSVADASFIDSSSIDPKGMVVNVNVLRNYDETITLGNDPVTGAAMYSHRSVQLQYVVDCVSGKLAIAAWKMFDGNFANGNNVWTDANWGKPQYTIATDGESRAVLASACAAALALRQSELMLTASKD